MCSDVINAVKTFLKIFWAKIFPNRRQEYPCNQLADASVNEIGVLLYEVYWNLLCGFTSAATKISRHTCIFLFSGENSSHLSHSLIGTSSLLSFLDQIYNFKNEAFSYNLQKIGCPLLCNCIMACIIAKSLKTKAISPKPRLDSKKKEIIIKTMVVIVKGIINVSVVNKAKGIMSGKSLEWQVFIVSLVMGCSVSCNLDDKVCQLQCWVVLLMIKPLVSMIFPILIDLVLSP